MTQQVVIDEIRRLRESLAAAVSERVALQVQLDCISGSSLVEAKEAAEAALAEARAEAEVSLLARLFCLNLITAYSVGQGGDVRSCEKALDDALDEVFRYRDELLGRLKESLVREISTTVSLLELGVIQWLDFPPELREKWLQVIS